MADVAQYRDAAAGGTFEAVGPRGVGHVDGIGGLERSDDSNKRSTSARTTNTGQHHAPLGVAWVAPLRRTSSSARQGKPAPSGTRALLTLPGPEAPWCQVQLHVQLHRHFPAQINMFGGDSCLGRPRSRPATKINKENCDA